MLGSEHQLVGGDPDDFDGFARLKSALDTAQDHHRRGTHRFAASGPYCYQFVISQPNCPFQEYLANRMMGNPCNQCSVE